MTAKTRQITISLALAAALSLGALVFAPPSSAQEQGLESLRQSGLAFRSVAKKVSPAVVFIQVEKTSVRGSGAFNSPFQSPFGDEFFRRFFDQPSPHGGPKKPLPKHRSQGQGSGFIVSGDGYILTNNHVVKDAQKVTVRMQDGRELPAEIVGTDPPSDLAVIKIAESELPYLQLGDSDRLEVGDWVLAVGNPFGLSHTLTAGIVSAKGRSGIGLNDYEDFIQTDAAINPGNSGGPLVDMDGRVVGINTAIFSRSGGYMGIGFAIPVNMAKRIRDQLIEHGQVTRGRLGVYIQELTEELAESFELDRQQGILVAQVMDDSPAEKAGLQRGDVIQELDGDKVGGVAEFRNRIALTSPDTRVKLGILRDGRKKTLTAKIGTLETDNQNRLGAAGNLSELGMSLQDLSPELAQRFDYQDDEGVLVSAVAGGSRAEQAGIQKGDLIQEVNRTSVSTVAQVREAIQSAGDKVLLLVKHGDATRYLALSLKD